jgi:hypothetical protein
MLHQVEAKIFVPLTVSDSGESILRKVARVSNSGPLGIIFGNTPEDMRSEEGSPI